MTDTDRTDGRAAVGVDVGGTFTDVALRTPAGRLATAKVPTTADQSVGVVRGIEAACERAAVEPAALDAFAHAMTVSVNALLEGDGATTALVTTEGFRDVLELGRQDRPDLYDLDATKPDPLVPRRRRFTVAERAGVDGVRERVDPADVRALAEEIREAGAESVAVSLLHAYAHPENEATVAGVLREELDVPVSASHEVLAEFREYERTATTAADAYVAPAIDAYLGRLAERAAERGVPEPRVMQSNGGVATVETVRERPVTTALSGPAAGVVGAAATVTDRTAHADTTDDGGTHTSTAAEVGTHADAASSAAGDAAAALDGFVTFDMGGTSSDVSLVRDGDAERTTEAAIAGHPIRVPMVDVTTVGAGGGSIGWVDRGGALRVGPRSAGADPGPACYGNGGTEATVTDANVALGYIGADATLAGGLDVEAETAHDALADLAEEAGLDGPLAAARGVRRVANANMTRAIRRVTVERGLDPREFGLVAFGGAGPMHAAALAGGLDVETVVVPRASGVLSAYGLLAADEKRDAVRTHRTALTDADPAAVADAYDALEAEALADLTDPNVAAVERYGDCRYAGQSFELTVPLGGAFDADQLAEAFAAAHERAYGYRLDDPVELVSLRVTATVERDPVRPAYEGGGDALVGTREAVFDDGARETAIYDRERLSAGGDLDGPAVLEGEESTVVVPPEWAGRVRGDGAVVLLRGECE